LEYFERRSEPSTSSVRGPPGSTGSISSSGRSTIVSTCRSPQSLSEHGIGGGAISRYPAIATPAPVDRKIKNTPKKAFRRTRAPTRGGRSSFLYRRRIGPKA
jgi:hypothetical protein